MHVLTVLFKSWRAKGDRARDRGRWRVAERAYRQHLRRRPDDDAIRVQHGHTLMRLGRPENAAAAYRISFDRDPNDLELLGQLSFALRDAGRRAEARETLLDFYARQPSEEVRGEIILLDDLQRGDFGPIAQGTIFISIQDLLGYLKVHSTMSGVQRVQAGIVSHADEHEGPVDFIVNNLTAKCDVLPSGTFWSIPGDLVRGIIRYASGETVDAAMLRHLILAAEDRAVRVSPGAETTIILLGAFWALGNSVRAILPNREAGAVIAAYIYDIIPITHPQYCDPQLCRDFGMSFAEACALVDIFLTISDATREAVGGFLTENGLRRIPMHTVRLAHRMTDEPEGRWPVAIETPGDHGLVAYVSTIEGRKNHIYVVRAWQELIRAGVDVPDLLFVGRQGWRVEPLMALLEETNFLDGRVRLVHDLSDSELDAIYRTSLFTIFTSFVEGWGLPVGESLARGTPCIASSTSSIPEVGGSLVDYIDPDDLASGIGVFERAIVDRNWQVARRTDIARDFVPRTWRDVARDFFAGLHTLAEEFRISDRPPLVVLPPGTLLDVAGSGISQIDAGTYARRPWRLLLADFYDPELGGAWLRGNVGTLPICTTIEAGKHVEIVLLLRGEDPRSERILSIAVEDGADIRGRIADLHGSPLVLPAETTLDGTVRIRWVLSENLAVRSQGARQFAVALVAFGYARAGDSATVEALISEARRVGERVLKLDIDL